ncbi:hypothetical protein [Haloplanus pelagicus]|uniref:hypothetical protein n=1 Tax=Haloplanus pelagicus TaxID=2949995 RepID=UPI00204033A9|nr:hypothetical protein [Haloplanus sp. HW8-1]
MDSIDLPSSEEILHPDSLPPVDSNNISNELNFLSSLSGYSSDNIVYVLRCRQMEPDSKIISRAELLYDDVDTYKQHYYPNWVDHALESELLLYVGWTNDVQRRITDHLTGEGAVFTEIFPPIGIVKLYPADTSREAKRMESQVASQLSDAVSGRGTIEFDDDEPYSFADFISEVESSNPPPQLVSETAYVYSL